MQNKVLTIFSLFPFQLGLPEYAEVSVPFEIESLRKDKVVAIACGAFHSLVLTSRGILYGFGVKSWKKNC